METVTSIKPSLWVDIQIAAAALSTTVDHLYKSVRRGRCTVRTQRIGHLLRFSAHDLGLFEDGIEALPINRKAKSLETSAKVSSSDPA